jgi:hypothetical protein
MLGTKRLFAYRKCELVERARPHKVALLVEQEGEAVEARCRIGMLGAERPFAHRQCTLEERPRFRKVALVLKQVGEILEARRRIGCSEPSALSRIANARS